MALTVTVVVPTRNRPRLLRRTVLTVLSQTHGNLELLVSDDGSEPAVELGLEDPRVRVLRASAAQGVSAARNLGIAAATGEFVAFLDDDDLWAPTKIQEQIRALQVEGRDWAYCGAFNFDSASGAVRSRTPGPNGGAVAAAIRWQNRIPGGCSNVLIRRSLLDRVGGFDPQLSQLADWDLWMRLAEHSTPVHVPGLAVGYRLHRHNMSNRLDQTLAEMRYLETKYDRKLDRPWVLRWAGGNALRQRNRRAALRAYWSAARCGGSRLLFVKGLFAFTAPELANAWLARRWRGPRIEWFEQLRSEGVA